MSHDEIDRWIDEMPEAKIELIDGNLVVGNCAAGNLRLLVDLLEGWGAEAALPMAPSELWRQALRLAFRRLDPPNADKPLEVWQSWAAQVSYSPQLKSVGPIIEVKHRGARLVRMEPLNIWSPIDLVVFDQGDSRKSWDASHYLYERFTDGPDIDLIDPERATRAEQQAVAAEAVEV